ncbi:unnamed protein product [Protopolystoma xenopodis]|uniref:CMP/dCMP-type deaminase domain-containing protein n=1 Tax=Protopolystoma xenopodis TaxID=117903 RepID=A0A448WMS1_9PLAT|nr:unnamed protein product [Protopolystoma xenopodis]
MDLIELCFQLAEEALYSDEVPIACAFLFNGNIVSKARNEVNVSKNATNHAEIIAIRRLEEYCRKNLLNLDEFVPRLTLFVTAEPCIMCTSALRTLFKSPPLKIIFGASNERFGGCGSVYNLDVLDMNLPQLSCVKGIEEKRSIDLLKRFYLTENVNAPISLRKLKR